MKLLFPKAVALAASVALGAMPSVARADPLPVGPAFLPGPSVTLYVPGTVLAYNSGPVAGCANCLFTGWLQTAVVRNAGGTLDFYYQFEQLTPATPEVNHLSMANFTGFTTDVFNISNGSAIVCGGCTFANANLTSNLASRFSASTVDFWFTATPFVGGSIATVVIKTNATGFNRLGNFNALDGGSASLLAFAPTTVPEPSSLMFVGTGLAGLVGFIRRRKAQK